MTDEHGKMLREQKQAWWTSVLAGQVDHVYPVPRTRLRPRFDDTTLIITGTVPSEPDRQEIQADLEKLVGRGISAFKCDLEVTAESEEEAGLLAQTLIGIFETEDQARFAASLLENQGQLQQAVLDVLGPGGSEISTTTRDALQTLLSDAHWEDVLAALAEGHGVLILTVDETQAFQAREILDEETRSLQTVVLPPIPASVAQNAARVLTERPTSSSASDPEIQRR